jgi:hypothetical protein
METINIFFLFYEWGKVSEFGPLFNFHLVHEHETLQRGNKYGNDVSILCTFLSYIDRDQKKDNKVKLSPCLTN